MGAARTALNSKSATVNLERLETLIKKFEEK
jgi:hypothetical protein